MLPIARAIGFSRAGIALSRFLAGVIAAALIELTGRTRASGADGDDVAVRGRR